MDKSRNRTWLVAFLFGAAVAIIVAWNVEAWIVSRGFVSNYLAPFGISALLATLYLRSRSR
jgi:hypothetical protein